MKTYNQPKILIDNTRGLRFTESPRWHQGKFWFLDIHGNAIRTVSLDGQLTTVLDLPFKPNGFGIRRDGSLVFGDALQRKVYRWTSGQPELLADLTGGTVFCLSDGILDAQERFYVGDIGYNFFDPANKSVDTCVIACVDPDGSSRVVCRDLHFPNGMALSSDGRTLIVAECMGNRLSAFDVLPDGGLAHRRVFAELPEGVHPDGIALDAEGAVWLANPEGQYGVLRVREGGEIVERVELDTHAYAVALGGPERRHLLICTSNTHNPAEIAAAPSATLRVIEVDVPGTGRP
jgi:sugar lactone lactonase YvrE